MAKKSKKKSSKKFSSASAAFVRVAYRSERIEGVPRDEVDDVLIEVQSDPAYISHTVLPEGGGTYTIIVIYRE